ncbi:MAG: 1-acyl-sn-glycerol-3-phosphate acyltransferase [Bacteroidales bacterium]|nr:1-acyl-sn-glycerol-3-phosphate acyltransferase [Bacteroidales bacterium]
MQRKVSFFYFVFQQYLKIWHRMYYRSIKIIKYTQIPAPYPAIYAPNHQNALMDALAILLTDYHQPFFLARADIFKSKFISGFLNRIKILPVYRIRDGAENLGKNDEVFHLTADIFKMKSPLGIFPEANHSVIRSLRPLKKGVMRVAFLAESENNWKLGLHIIPMGIYYSDIQKMNQDLIVIYGKAIPLLSYREEFEQSEVAAFNHLRKDMAAAIREHIIDIQDQEDYVFHESILQVFQAPNRHKATANPIPGDQQIVQKLAEVKSGQIDDYQRFKDEFEAISQKLPAHKAGQMLHAWLHTRGNQSIALLLQIIIAAPLALIGLVIFGLPHLVLSNWVNRSIKDVCFKSTIYFAFSWVVYTFWILIIGIIAASFFPLGFIGFTLTAVLGGYTAIRWLGQVEQYRYYRKIESLQMNQSIQHWYQKGKALLGLS